MSFPSIVALVSDSRRAAVTHLAERAPVRSGGLQFAATTAELARSVTSESLVVIEGSRLGELAAVARGGAPPPYCGARASAIERGEQLDWWLSRMPATTRTVWQEALGAPRAWSVKRVAHAAGVSTRQLVRQCHRAGCTISPKDLLLSARLAAMQTLLCAPRPLRVLDLARACGWVDARSLRAALRRASLSSLAALAQLGACRATMSDIAARLDRSGT